MRAPPRTKWTRRVPHPVLIGHAARGQEKLTREELVARHMVAPPPPPPPTFLLTTHPTVLPPLLLFQEIGDLDEYWAKVSRPSPAARVARRASAANNSPVHGHVTSPARRRTRACCGTRSILRTFRKSSRPARAPPRAPGGAVAEARQGARRAGAGEETVCSALNGGRGGQGRAKPPLRREDIGHIYSDEMLAQSDTRHPVAPDLRLAVARALAHLGEIELEYWDRVPEAEQLFQRALTLAPALPDALCGWASAVSQVGERLADGAAAAVGGGQLWQSKDFFDKAEELIEEPPPPPYLMLPLPMSLLYPALIEERQPPPPHPPPKAGGPRLRRAARITPEPPPTGGGLGRASAPADAHCPRSRARPRARERVARRGGVDAAR